VTAAVFVGTNTERDSRGNVAAVTEYLTAKLLGIKTQADIVTMEMNALPGEEIADIVRAGGCTLVDLTYSNSTERGRCGMIEFFNRPDAVARITSGITQRQFL
jgi:hypothetical protein